MNNIRNRFIYFIMIASVFTKFVFISDPALSQHIIAGTPVNCVDFRGIPVTLVPDPNLNDVGKATVANNGAPVMFLNPAILYNLPRELQLFWYAHECAHHALGHIQNYNLMSESEADCWAIKVGRNQGWFPLYAFQGLIAMFRNNPGSPWGHFPGPQRVQHMMNCYNQFP